MLDNTGDQSDVMSPLIELGSLLANSTVDQTVTTVLVQLGAARHLTRPLTLV